VCCNGNRIHGFSPPEPFPRPAARPPYFLNLIPIQFEETIMTRRSRRTFLKNSLAAGATFVIAGTKSSGKVLGANETVRVGVAGLNGRGSAHIGALAGMAGVQITYLIDPDTKTYDRHQRTISAKGGNTAKTVRDVREALDDKNLDAITIATPNHWHALMTIWGCQAGKDVYVEKPCSHNVHEGRIAVETARKYNRIVQHGTQSRSSGNWARVAAVIASGKLGKLLVARALCYKPRNSIGPKGEYPVPESVDFNLWSGPAQLAKVTRPKFHYDWHWQWEYGNGDIGNQGVHQMDIARWGIPGATLPKSILTVGGRFGYEDAGETPNTEISVLDFGDTQLIFEVRGLKTGGLDVGDGKLIEHGPDEKGKGEKVGNLFHLEAGTIVGSKFYPKGSDKPASLPEVEVPKREGDHFGNFISAVRSRNPQDLNADILEGHYSSALCHLANISYRLGEPQPFNQKTKAFGDNKAAYETLARTEEHLRANGLMLDGMTYQLGRKLSFDAQTEKFVDDSQANALLTRDYRAPFVVPDKV
jgi:predicted dehydrogenase